MWTLFVAAHCVAAWVRIVCHWLEKQRTRGFRPHIPEAGAIQVMGRRSPFLPTSGNRLP